MGTLFCRTLDANHDATFGRGKAGFSYGAKGTAQRLKCRLLLNTGEWFWDTDDGTPWYQSEGSTVTPILNTMPANAARAEAILKARILSTDGVAGISTFTLTVDRQTRGITINANGPTVDGDIWNISFVVGPQVVVTPFAPTDLGSTLKLWLRGDLGITQSSGNVTVWADQSGNGNNVTNVGTVPYVASSINGKPGVTCGTGYLRNTTQSPLAAGSPRTIFLVVRASTSTGGVIYSGRLGTPDSALFLPSSLVSGLLWSDLIDGTRSASIPVPTINGVPLILQAGHSGTGGFVTCKLSGVAQTVTETNPVQSDSGTVGFAIGDRTGSFPPNVDIAEVIVCDTVLSSQNEAAVKNYLSARYSI